MRVKKLCIVLTFCFAIALSSSCRALPHGEVDPVEKKMIVTGYCKCGECCGWHRTWYGKAVSNATGERKRVGITASGTRAGKGTIAADPTVYPFGTIMYVKGYGYGRVEDTGSKIKGHHIDLFFSSHATAKQWGKQEIVVKVWLPTNSKR